MPEASTHTRIFAVVRRIPRGRVSTYGQVARLAGMSGQARLVGYALSSLPAATRVPWHRVVNAKGEISPRRGEVGPNLRQRLLLDGEGVTFDAKGRISLDHHGWVPRQR